MNIVIEGIDKIHDEDLDKMMKYQILTSVLDDDLKIKCYKKMRELHLPLTYHHILCLLQLFNKEKGKYKNDLYYVCQQCALLMSIMEYQEVD